MSTKRTWEPVRWGVKANRAIGSKEDARTLNEYLDVLQGKAYEVRLSMIERGEIITSAGLRDFLSGARQRKW